MLRAPRARLLRVAALVDQAIMSVTNIATVVILARLAGSDQLGLYSLGMTAVFIALNVQESLISAPYMVFVNLKALRGRTLHRYTGTVLLQTLILGLITGVLLLLAAFAAGALGSRVSSSVSLALAGAILFVLIREAARRCCLAQSQMALLLVMDTIGFVVQIALLLAVDAVGELNAELAIGLLGFSSAISFLVWIVVVRGAVTFRRSSLLAHSRRSWSFGKWVLWTSVATVLTHYSVHWMLAIGIGAGATGVFEAIRTLANLINPLVSGIRNYIGPLSARYLQQSGVRATHRLVRSTEGLILGLGLVWLTVIYFAGDNLLIALYGSAYGGYGSVLLATTAAFVTFGLGMPADQGLWALKRPATNAFAATLGLFATVSLALVLGADLRAAALGLLAGKVLEAVVKILGFTRSAKVLERFDRRGETENHDTWVRP